MAIVPWTPDENPKTVDQFLDEMDYDKLRREYEPTEFGFRFIQFIAMVNGSEPEVNRLPTFHYCLADDFGSNIADIMNLCFRGSAKTTMLEYLVLYIAVFEGLPHIPKISFGLFLGYAIDGAVKEFGSNMRKRWEGSPFLQKYIPTVKITKDRWNFTNSNGHALRINAYGVKTGIRGARFGKARPNLLMIDDILKDGDSKSDLTSEAVEEVVGKALSWAKDPMGTKTIWNGTPFDAKDIMYKRIEAGTWKVNVFPSANKFPCTRETFVGAWEDRFTYDFLQGEYSKASREKRVGDFMQEAQLRIITEADRLVDMKTLARYSRADLLANRSEYRFYITTDFATKESESSDYSTINVWAHHKGAWHWVEGYCEKALMDANIDKLFEFAGVYRPIEVGIEITGQQGGFLAWINKEMQSRKIHFNLAGGKSNTGMVALNKQGIHPLKDKLQRFLINALPFLRAGLIRFPEDYADAALDEMLAELGMATARGFKSRYKDQIDNISMLAEFSTWDTAEDPIPTNVPTHIPNSVSGTGIEQCTAEQPFYDSSEFIATGLTTSDQIDIV